MAHWPYLSDPVRWNVIRHMRVFDQPPAVASFTRLHVPCPAFICTPPAPGRRLSVDGTAIRVQTPRQVFHFDHLICATGYALDLCRSA